MAQSKDDKGTEEFVIEEEEQPQKKDAVRKGDVERYEVRIGPPMVSGRKVKPLMTGGEKGPGGEAQRPGAPVKPGEERKGEKGVVSYGSTQQIYKIEDDLRRTRDIVEDLKHTVGIMEGDLRDLKAEMERMSYLLRSLEGLKNAMKDIESTVSELSGLYDLISANVNPFIDMPSLKTREGRTEPQGKKQPLKRPEKQGFSELTEIFGEETSGPRPPPEEEEG